MTPDLICLSTYQLLWSPSSDFGPDVSFDMSVSPDPLPDSARAILAEVSMLRLFSRLSRETIPLRVYSEFLQFFGVRIPFSTFLLSVFRYFKNDVERLCVCLIRLREMKEEVLVRSSLSSVCSNRKCDPMFRRKEDKCEMSIFDFMTHPSWGDAKVVKEPHHLPAPLLDHVPQHTTAAAAEVWREVVRIKRLLDNLRVTAAKVVEGFETTIAPSIAEENAQRRLAIKKRFRGNAATKKTQRNLLKQQYENFTASSLEVLDQTFDRVQKLISQLEIHGESISQEDVNQKFLRSLSPEWNTHTIVWRNKPEIDTLSLDDLYNNLKIYEP
ncbi:hypothetical protein Tco_0355602 [Tanacetum coccineum]